MLEAKNLELAGCYHQEPMSYPALLTWCEEQAELFGPYIADTGEYLEQAVSEGKKVVLEAQDVYKRQLHSMLIHKFISKTASKCNYQHNR